MEFTGSVVPQPGDSQNEQGSVPASIPVDAVQADQLPRERGIHYDEVCQIVGSLYLDSHLKTATLEDQFKAVSEEYKEQLERASLQLQATQQEIGRLKQNNQSLRRELEKRNVNSSGTRTGTSPVPDYIGDDALHDNG